ncbi:MAG: hypothetical protein J7501_00370 [Bdellovibrio sp.]|nr:hypothetical protein [Bdellovibrio sp.]
METSVRTNIFYASVFLLSLLSTACSLNLDISSAEPFRISGNVDMTQISTMATCSEPDSVSLYEVVNGVQSTTALQTINLPADGSFTFSIQNNTGSDLLASSRYVLQAQVCGKTLSRPVTGTSAQIIDFNSNFLAIVAKANIAGIKSLNQITTTDLQDILSQIATLTVTSTKETYSTLLDGSHNTIKQRIETAFNISDLNLVKDATVPEIVTFTQPTTVAEGSSADYAVMASHWYYASSDLVYDWHWDGVSKGTASSFSLPLSKNSQGTHSLLLQVGITDGAGAIDTSKAVNSKAVSVKVPNTFPAIVPAAALTTGSPTNANLTTISLNTGASFENCETFSKIAITENATSLGLTDSDFSGVCSTAGVQDFNYTLSPSEGVKTIYIWSKDASGYISTSPRILSVILDQTPPNVTIGSVKALYHGGEAASLSYTVTDTLTNIVSLKLQFIDNGTTMTNVAELAGVASPYTVTLPSINNSAVYKLIASDEAGNSTEISSSSFVVDSTAPAAPSLSLTSASLTADSLVTFNVLDCSDIKSVYVTESATAPTLSSSGWVACSSAVPYTRTITGDSTHTIRVWSQDAAGNISAAAATLSITLDTTAPTLSWVSPTTDAPTNSTVSVSWKVTDLHTSTAQNTVLSYSTDAGATWTVLSTQSLPAGSASAQTYSFSYSTPAVTTSIIFRVTATDSLNHTTTSTKNFVVDSQGPTLNSLTLAGGASIVGLPSVSAQLNVTPTTSATAYMRLAENSDLSAETWIPYTPLAFSYELSKTGGLKTVYAQVKNSAGFESNVVSSSVTLEFGAPPVVTVTSPLASGGPYANGNSINIQWSCTTSGSTTLASSPISLSYTADDGVSYNPIVSDIANSGTYSWTVPSEITTLTPFKILVSCESSAGVVSTGLSGIMNSIWTNLVGSPGNMDYGIHINATDISKWTPVHGDSNNNLYAGSKNGIIKVDRKSGIVNQWVGLIYSGGCPTSSSTFADMRFITPRIIDITNDEMTIISGPCHTVTRIKITDKSIVWTRTVPEVTWSEGSAAPLGFYVKKDQGYYYFPTPAASGVGLYAYWKLDLSSTSTTAERILGDGVACSTAALAVSSTPTDTLQAVCTAGNQGHFVVSPDQQTINYYYMTTTGANYKSVLSFDSAQGKYVVTSSATTTSLSENLVNRCVQVGTDSSRYVCVPAEGQARTLNYFDTATNKSTGSNHILSTFNNNGTMQLSIGASPTSAYALSTVTNELFEIKFKADGTLSSTLIGGSPFFTFGNGTDPAKVAFTGVMGMTYSPVNNAIYVRGVNHIRRLKIDNVALKISEVDTAMASGFLGNSSAFGGLAVSADGTSMAASRTNNGRYPWDRANMLTWTSTVSSTTQAYTLTGTAGTTSYYDGTGTAIDPETLTLGTSFASNYSVFLHDWSGSATFLSNGSFYFPATSDGAFSRNLWIYESKKNTANANYSITPLAGAVGDVAQATALAPGVGSSAIGTSFKRIYGMQPTAADGSGNTDLLIFDAQRLRRISFVTESSAPKVYDEIDYSNFANYPGDLPWSHAVYDTSTHWSYFVISGGMSLDSKPHIYAAHASSGFTELSLNGLNLSNATVAFGRTLALEVTPLGLLMLDSANKRILSTPLKH